jgi:D-alanyl-D-alanine dipeptidase
VKTLRPPTLALLLTLISCTAAVAPNRYGPRVVSTPRNYQMTVALDPDNRLVDLARAIPGIHLDLHYATAENFMRRRLYPRAVAFLRSPAAAALRDVEVDLRSRGLGIVVWDAYRPYAVTEEMWARFKNPDFVADPAKGSRHNRGAAVDVTLVDLASGHELDMPTAHDEFSARAASDYAELPASVIQNRAILREVMSAHGFDQLPSEWWHFDYRGWKKFDLLDLPFDAIP